MLKAFLNSFFDPSNLQPLRRRLQQEPYYRFQNFAELQLAASWGIRIDANTATTDDWLRLPGISIHQANLLTKLTTQGLCFSCIEDVAAALSLTPQQIQAWEAVLQFCYYEPQQRLEPMVVDINTATHDQLLTIPSVDTFLARAIVHYRKAGPYQDLAELQQRLRLTTQVTASLLHYVRF